MILLAEHDIGLYLQIGTSVLFALIVPGIIKVIIKLTQLDVKINNGISSEIQSLRREVIAQREEFGKRIHDMEITIARSQGGDSGIHST